MAANLRLSPILKVLVENHKKGTNAVDTAVKLLVKKHYRYPEVCVASVNYWFDFFTEHPNYFSTETNEFYVRFEERLAFLSVLLETNPFWTIDHFKDALKLRNTAIRELIQLLSKNYQRGISAENSVTELISNGSFEFPGASKAAVKYWFDFFNDHPNRFSNEYSKSSVTCKDRLDFLSALLRDNPDWTITHFMDALKVCRRTVRRYMKRLEFVSGPLGWTKPHRTSR
ncbi:hypothetical protein M0804_009830 [Polistes exclamans]|nr:hypothetical protein M0804_009830 [Polistes exclamans]